MANAEFEQLRILAQEIRQGIVRPLGKTGFYNTDLYEGLLRKNGFLTNREAELTDRANSQVGRSKLDWEKYLEHYAAQSLNRKGQIATAKALMREKKSSATLSPGVKQQYHGSDGTKAWNHFYTKFRRLKK